MKTFGQNLLNSTLCRVKLVLISVRYNKSITSFTGDHIKAMKPKVVLGPFCSLNRTIVSL